MAALLQPASVVLPPLSNNEIQATGPNASVTPNNASSVRITPNYTMASLYVGDLEPEVTEAMLFEKFSLAGPVLSIRVCRDAISRSSLGYAYVNFQQPNDAKRAIETLNFDVIMKKPIRIMWSQRDPSIRRSGTGNVFIKNLDKHIDTKAIYDTFSMFGNILSCKVANNPDGTSKGFGFIHFETEEAALKAIEKVNGMLLEGKKVFVGKFLPRMTRLREIGEPINRYTNIYIKNFADELNDETLYKLFSKFGNILSCVAMCNSEGHSKGFGFVNFQNCDDAERAVMEMNDYELPKTKNKLTVCRAQKKEERRAELKRKFAQRRLERIQRYQGVNLYVKNLDDMVTDEILKKSFEDYGKITSAKVMCDENNRSKGFGFVCFEKPEDATKAAVEMNNKLLASKPLYVALAQRKEDRKAQLASQYMQRLAAMRVQNSNTMTGTMYNPSSAGFFVPSNIQNQQTVASAFISAPTTMSNQLRNSVRWNNYNGNAFSGFNRRN